ncbi:MAG: hypothetical protein ACRDKT_11570 [Actinomycetota bacterium]
MRGDPKRPRLPGLVYSATSLVVLLLVGVVAFAADQPPPPTIAEFAPTAVDQIEEAPSEQASDFGGEGDFAGSGGKDKERPRNKRDRGNDSKTKPIRTAQVRACVGNPPRQIEDPQSPPCVPYWEGDNGGATSKGVTASEIRIAIPNGEFFGYDEKVVDAIVGFFNSRFEFYGRKIRPLYYIARGDSFAEPNPADMQADAAFVDEELDAFASTGYMDRRGGEFTYYEDLARRGVISTLFDVPALATEARLRANAPYIWSPEVSIDTLLSGLGKFTCSVLEGEPPEYAGRPENAAETRKFGVIAERLKDGTIPDTAPLLSALGACGVRPVTTEAPSPANASEAQTPILRMKNEGVTSLICLCYNPSAAEGFMPAATQQGYSPEWIAPQYALNDYENSFDRNTARPQNEHVFGITYKNRWMPKQDMPYYWAMKEGDPSADHGGWYWQYTRVYWQLLLLSSGIQMAGPELTPATFERALHETTFPNPGIGGVAPLWQAKVGFPGGRHFRSADAIMYWLHPRARGTVDPSTVGRMCFVADGLRFEPEQWGRAPDDPAFFEEC